MLKSFTVENYKCFRDPITIDFSEKHDYKFNNSSIKNGLLSKIVIYGANSSGKSNFGFALFDIVGVLTNKNTHEMQREAYSFINADSDSKEARFAYVFKKNEELIEYEYKKSSPDKITFEKLSINGTLIFAYDFISQKREFEHLDIIGAENLNFEYFENNFAVLRYIAYNTLQQEDSYVRFIMNFVSSMLWFRSLQDNGYIGLTTGGEMLDQWIANNRLEKDFQRFLEKIAGIKTDIEVLHSRNEIPILIEKHKNASFIFSGISSSGTKALELLFYWSKRFNEVSFLFLDEFDAFYHFDLAKNVLKYIIQLDNIQAVFTTHNSYLASNDILRPDCYFTLKDGKLTSFVDSTDREIREGHNLEKLLRNGEFNG